jgi:hypothetical protein
MENVVEIATAYLMYSMDSKTASISREQRELA